MARGGIVRACTDAAAHRARRLSSLSRGPPATVLVSTSNDVHRNLALEDWLYQRLDWTLRPPTLLLWRNAPCVVIGRHQNPWLECRLSSVANSPVKLARRNSGGGAVFHDAGNLNCTFFTSRTTYDRKSNLEMICRAIVSLDAGLDVRVSSRLDILLDDRYKISGTASKLARNVAYHHCTVLADVDTGLLSRVLRTSEVVGVESKATQSVKSPVRNLGLRVEDVASSIAEHFAGQKPPRCLLVEPTEDEFPGITQTAHQLESWEWIFGRCPPFKVERVVSVPKEFDETGSSRSVLFKAAVNKGTIESVSVDNFDCDGGGSGDESLSSLRRATQSIVGSRLSPDDWPTTGSLDVATKNWITVSCFADIV